MSLTVAHVDVVVEGADPDDAITVLLSHLEELATDGWTVHGDIHVEQDVPEPFPRPRWLAKVTVEKQVEVP